MEKMLDTIVVKRLVRNLRYRQTYIKAFESFLETEPRPEIAGLLHVLIGAQESAVVLLTRYLRGLGVAVPDRPVKRLLDHASVRKNARSQLWFIRYGLTKAASWYKEQLVDRQMTADPDLKRLLFELGEREASALWRTQMVIARLGIREGPGPEVPSRVGRDAPGRAEHQPSGGTDRTTRPPWGGERRPARRWQPGREPGG